LAPPALAPKPAQPDLAVQFSRDPSPRSGWHLELSFRRPKGRNLHTPSRHAPGGLQRSADSGKPVIMRRPSTPPYNCGSGLPEQLGPPGTA